MSTTIETIRGRRVWDSRGRPTVEVTCAGGSGEAVDRRDGGADFGGHDVAGAVAAVNGEIAETLAVHDAAEQETIDAALIDLDGTENKARLGGNALIATSMAVAHAAAAARGLPLWRHLGGGDDAVLPLPEIQIFGGGAHAGRRVDVQDFMVIAVGAADYVQALDWTAEVYRAAGGLMAERGLLQGVADEGGFWPAFESNEEALGMLVRAIEAAGLRPGQDMAISLDIAATEFGAGGRYRLARDGTEMDSDGLCEMLLGWLGRYPIVSIEDPLGEDDEAGLIRFTHEAGPGVQVVGDDYIVTNAERIRSGVEAGACNCALIKPNQAGTLSETRAAFMAARKAGWGAIVSARSGESEDVTIVHLATGWGAHQLKVCSFARSERLAKWNEGLRLADALGSARLPDKSAFPWG